MIPITDQINKKNKVNTHSNGSSTMRRLNGGVIMRRWCSVETTEDDGDGRPRELMLPAKEAEDEPGGLRPVASKRETPSQGVAMHHRVQEMGDGWSWMKGCRGLTGVAEVWMDLCGWRWIRAAMAWLDGGGSCRWSSAKEESRKNGGSDQWVRIGDCLKVCRGRRNSAAQGCWEGWCAMACWRGGLVLDLIGIRLVRIWLVRIWFGFGC